MLKNIEDYQMKLQSDGELMLNLQSKLASLNIKNFDALVDFCILKQISSLEELHEYLRSKDCDFELTLLLTEVATRIKHIKHGTLNRFISSMQVGNFLIELFNGEMQEQLIAIFMDTKNRVVGQKLIFKGSLNRSIAHPREILEPAILLHSATIIIAHNHPSGETTPSKQDLEFTAKLCDACSIVGIECLDHIIVGESAYLSMREQNLI